MEPNLATLTFFPVRGGLKTTEQDNELGTFCVTIVLLLR